MEIYSNSADRTVFIDVPVTPTGGYIDITATRSDGTVEVIDNPVTVVGNRYSVTIPYYLCQDESKLDIRWEFEYSEGGIIHVYTHTTPVEIVTPYIPLAEIQTIIGNNSDYTPKQIEHSVRQVINSYTGQNFHLHRERKLITSRGQASLEMPERVVELISIEPDGFGYKVYDIDEVTVGGYLGKGLFQLDSSGWRLASGYVRLDNGIKSDNQMTVTGPIFYPWRGGSLLTSGRSLYVDAKWGWKEVPAAVQEAARLLVNDYACGDGLYRDRYIEAMTTSDWRLQFNSGAFSGTGNIRADQLLAPYVLTRGWAVI